MFSFLGRFQQQPMLLALLLPVLLVPLFFVHLPLAIRSPVFLALWDLGHIVFFGAIAFSVQRYYRLVLAWQWLLVAGLAFVVGGSIELIQGMTGRNASWGDMARNMTGIWLGLAWGASDARYVRWHRLVATALLLPLSFPFFQAATDRIVAARAFPQLAGFERPAELLYWHGSISRVAAPGDKNGYALKADFDTSKYSGVYFEHFPRDWSGYQTLAFEVYNPGDGMLPLVVRIHDALHAQSGRVYGDRFNRRLSAQPGWNYFRIELDDIASAPVKRQIQLDRIESFGIFVVRLPQPQSIYLDNLRLE